MGEEVHVAGLVLEEDLHPLGDALADDLRRKDDALRNNVILFQVHFTQPRETLFRLSLYTEHLFKTKKVDDALVK